MRTSVLDRWIQKRIGGDSASALTRDGLAEYQLMKINETLTHSIENSPFYGRKLSAFKNHGLRSLDEIGKLPFTTAEELVVHGEEMLCVSGGMISRIVTLHTSGSAGAPKRIYFTEEDQELTVDFFHHGMRNLVDTSDTLLILLPCAATGSVGELLARGLGRLGCRVVPYGFPHVEEMGVLAELGRIIKDERVTSIVGSPGEVLRIAEFTADEIGSSQIRAVLLSTDYIPEDLCRRLTELWGCRVFEHYGMTEMGLGGAVSCDTLIGYHPRENDLYFEIIDPDTSVAVREGEYGEIVFTTLTRKGMPFIRYRTGDRGRWLPGQCPCGSVLKRLDRVLPRGVKKYQSVRMTRDAEIRRILQED